MNNSKTIGDIQGFIFDIGDIIYDASPWRKWLLRELRSAGVNINYMQLVARWESLLVDVYIGKSPYWDRFDNLLSGLGINGEQASRFKEASQQKGRNVQLGRQPFPHVAKTLAKLKSLGYRVAALSDTESTAEKVGDTLRGLKVGGYFDSITTSKDCGFCKPSTQAYEIACQSVGLSSDACAFVGHDVDELAGASLAGLTSIAFNYDPDAIADIFIDRFDQLLDFVHRSDACLSGDLEFVDVSSTGELP